MSEERRRQLNALLDKEWGDVGAGTTVVRFPRAMKRGAKVRRGPRAEILQFPALLSSDELESRFLWILENAGKWEVDEVDGAVEEEPSETRCQLSQIVRNVRETLRSTGPTEIAKRQRIVEGRQLIEKRNSVKDWLESLGADLDALGAFNPAEKALFFVFDRMHECKQPTIA